MEQATINLIKKEYRHLDTLFFNSAYFGPSPYRAKQKVTKALQTELDPSFYSYDLWSGIPDRLRRMIARLLNCSADNITHSTSTTDIINMIACGFQFESSKDVVATINLDYPSNILSWMVAEENGVCKHLNLNLEDEVLPSVEWLKSRLPKETKILDISYVTFDTGKSVDIKGIGELCKERDILFVVDATQALGGMEITKEELSLIDVLVCSSYKWMLGPYGHGFAYFSDNALKKIKAKRANWLVSPNSKDVSNLLSYTTQTQNGARKFDRGQSPNMLAMSCLEASLEFLLEVGLKNIQKKNANLKKFFLENFPRQKYSLITPEESKSNILALRAKSIDPFQLERELKYRNIDVSIRQGNLRLSFHLFNDEEQAKELIRALDL